MFKAVEVLRILKPGIFFTKNIHPYLMVHYLSSSFNLAAEIGYSIPYNSCRLPARLSASILAHRQVIFYSTLFPLISQNLKIAFRICENLGASYFCESSFPTLAQSKLATLSLYINMYMNSLPLPCLSLCVPGCIQMPVKSPE